jgi:hypothetical protein
MAEIVIDKLSLTTDPVNGMSFGAEAKLQQLVGNAMQDMAIVAGGIGAIPALPVNIATAFPLLVLPASPLQGLWFSSSVTSVNNCDYCFNIGNNFCSVYCVQSLLNNALVAPGFVFSQLLLKVMINIRDGQSTVTQVSIAGKLSYNGSLAQVDLAGGSFDFVLELTTFDASDGNRIMRDPLSALISGYSGALTFSAAGRQFTLANTISASNAVVKFSLAITSDNNSNAASVDDILFQLQAAEIQFNGAKISNPSIEGHLHTNTNLLELKGDVSLILPDTFYNLFNASNTPARSVIHAAFGLSHQANGAASAFFLLEERLMKGPVHDLGFSSKKLCISYERNGNSWQTTLGIELMQSLAAVKDWFVRQGLAEFPGFEFLPVVKVILQGTANNNSLTALSFKMVLLENMSASSSKYKGMIPRMQVMIGNMELLVNVSFNQNAFSNWRIAGTASVSTTGQLYGVMPVSNILCTIAASAVGAGIPQLKLTISNNPVSISFPGLSVQAAPITIFQVNQIVFMCGEVWGIEATGAFNPDNKTLAQHLGINGEGLLGFLNNIEAAIPLSGVGYTVRCSAKAIIGSNAGNTNNSFSFSCEIIFDAAPAFELFHIFSNAKTQIADESKSVPCPNLLSVKPGRLFFETEFAADGDARLRVGFSLICSILNETFDASAMLEIMNSRPVLRFMAGLVDPITLRIPVPDPSKVLGVADINKIVTDYKLSNSQKASLLSIKYKLDEFFNAPGQDNHFVFEMYNLGITIDPAAANPFSVGGSMKLIQFPGVLKAIEPPDGFALSIESSADSISIKLETSGSEPLLSIPLGSEQRRLELFLYALTISYNWAQNAVGGTFDGKIDTKPQGMMGVEVFGSGAYLPESTMSMGMKLTVTAPPVPVPQWSIKLFQDNPQTAKDDLGLQAWVGIPGHRFVSWYLRQTHFSPTYVYLMPGLQFDGGAIIGDIDPSLAPSRQDLINMLLQRDAAVRNKLFAHFDFDNGLIALISWAVAVILNPMNIVPIPNPVPPYMIVPPSLYGDLFFDRVSISVNVPGLFFYSIAVEKPLPKLTIQAMLELAALALTGFSTPIPAASELRKVYYVKCSGDLRIPLAELLSGQSDGAQTQRKLQDRNADSIELNVADLMNGMIDLAKMVKDVFTTGPDLVEMLVRDPSLLVSMIPKERRRFQMDTSLAILGFSCSGSLYLLTPEELRKELLLFHENKKVKEKGMKVASTTVPLTMITVNKLPVFESAGSYKQLAIADPTVSFNANDAAVIKYNNEFKDRMASRMQERITERRRDLYNEVINKMIVELKNPQNFSNPATRRTIFRKYKIEKYAADVERIVLENLNSGTNLSTVSPSKLVDIKKKVVDHLLEAAEIKIVPGLTTTYEETAKQIVVKTLSQPAAPMTVTPPPSFNPAIAGVPSNTFTIASPRINMARFKPAFTAEMNVLVSKTSADLRLPANAAKKQELTSKLESDLVTKLQQHYPAQLVTNMHLKNNLQNNFQSTINKFSPIFPASTARIQRPVATHLFNGSRSIAVLENIGIKVETLIPGETVTEVRGYKIQNKAITAGNIPAGRFSVPGIKSKTVLVEVRRKGLKFYLYDDNTEKAALPSWLTALVPESPRKAGKLKALLEITEDTVVRNKTASEKNYEKEVTETSDTNYKLSILARDEYEIKPDGGRHGKFYFGDLLRKTNGAYIIPSSPVFMAGFTVKIGDQQNYSELNFAGMVAKDAVFLHAHSKIVIVIGDFKMQMEGDFHLITGDLWGSSLAGGLTKDSMSFNGTASFSMDDHEHFRGSASGFIKSNGLLDLPDIDLRVRVDINGEQIVGIEDLELPNGHVIPGVKMIKIGWDTHFQQKLILRKRQSSSVRDFDLSGIASINVKHYINKGTKKTMVIDEEGGILDTVVDGIVGFVSGGRADTSGGTEVDYIDYSVAKWELQSPIINATISASLDNAGVHFSLNVPGWGNFMI